MSFFLFYTLFQLFINNFFHLLFRENDDGDNNDSTCSVEVVGLGTLVQNMLLCCEPLHCHFLAIFAWGSINSS